MKSCPNDASELKTRSYKKVTVDECEVCHGMFFDRGELERARANTDPDISWLDTVLFSAEGLANVEKEIKTCPSCSSSMDPLEYANSKVVINKCQNCAGVWLDSGEFAKIIQYLESIVQHETAGDFANYIKQQMIDILVGPKKESEELRELMAVTRLFEQRWVAEHPRIATFLEMYYESTPFK